MRLILTSSMLLAMASVVAASPFPDGPGAPSRLAAEPAPLRVDHRRSSIVAITGKEGMLGFLGHRHAIVARDWTAEIRYDPERPEETRVDVDIPVASLESDTRRAREVAGMEPDGGPSPEDMEEIRGKMVGERYLTATDHPEIRFRTVAAREGYGKLVVGGPLTIRGVSRNKNVSLTVEPDGEGYRVQGSFQVNLTDFAMEPESIAGVVRVADEVDIRIDILAVAAGD